MGYRRHKRQYVSSVRKMKEKIKTDNVPALPNMPPKHTQPKAQKARTLLEREVNECNRQLHIKDTMSSSRVKLEN